MPIPELVHSFAVLHSSPGSPLLAELEAATRASHPKSHMLSGPLQGRFLAMVSRMVAPRRILEIGTFTGYSALCLAEGLQSGGFLHTVESREQEAETAQAWFDRSEWKDSILLHRGEALDVLAVLQETWDLVFIDADKVNYTAYYEAVIPALRPGGFILADNMFFHGEVLKEPVTGKNAVAIEAFLRHVSADPRTEQVMLSMRDGLLLIRKMNEIAK
jgi:predicted O-methyltransferase YrrM